MQSIAEYMSANHRACDDAFANAEQVALACNWEGAAISFNKFRSGMNQHFEREEADLFPALLAAGGPAGPVRVMQMEHAQMNMLFEQMAEALVCRDAQKYGGLSETLLIVMQQHNMKEEQMLYPIADQYLSSQREALIGRMQIV